MLKSGSSDNPDRQAAVAGSFYPSDPVLLISEIEKNLKAQDNKLKGSMVRALIVPHAGYIYSGQTAASGYASINDWQRYKRVFLIGSSHHYRFNGAALFSDGNFITPLGKVKVDNSICSILQEKNTLFTKYNEAHIKEHSLEVQLPFLQYFIKENLTIIPILLGTDNTNDLERIAKELLPWFTRENLFIFSSDFSHYPGYEQAVELDDITADMIIKKSAAEFADWIRKCEKKQSYGALTPMCGWSAGLVLKYLAEAKSNLEFMHLNYSNSGDSVRGDKSGVVGYHAIALVERSEEYFWISEKHQQTLLSLARANITSWLTKRKFLSAEKIPPGSTLNEEFGVFVSLKLDGKLRGCIGKLHASEPLNETVRQMSVAAAFNDSRFEPLTMSELENVKIEISVLSKMRKVDDIGEIIPGKHGIYLKKDMITATFLPQVATEQNWNRDELLGNLSKNKAGLGWSGWKEAELYIYEAIVFEE